VGVVQIVTTSMMRRERFWRILTSGEDVMRVFSLGILVFAGLVAFAGAEEDPFSWLEEVESPKALEWVEARNRETMDKIEKLPRFEEIRTESLKILDSDARIPSVEMLGGRLYNFWQDAQHPRGIWRRTTLESFRRKNPEWETVLDVDALCGKDGKSWVWKGAVCLEPDAERCMIALSAGGGDAVVQREFDLTQKVFVPDGFELPEAKSSVAWKDRDHLWVGTDFGKGSLTDSGYPRLVKLWTRGTPLEKAEEIFEGRTGDVAVSAMTIRNSDGVYDLVSRSPAFFKGEYFLRLDGRLVRLEFPDDASLAGIYRDHVLVTLRSDWKPADRTYPQGSLLAIELDDFLQGKRDFDVLFEPGPRSALSGVARTGSCLILSILDNVRGRLEEIRLEDGAWKKTAISLPGMGEPTVTAASHFEDYYFFAYSDFLTPPSLFLGSDSNKPELLKSNPAFFDSEGMKVEQAEAISADGTKIPYFLIMPAHFSADGKNPTILYGYGGFEISMTPFYWSTLGKNWLEKGGVLVIANIRGGGEFGPSWHTAALRENRPRAFEDFIAVGDDLVARGITSHRHLGIMGGSNGGLLVGAVMVMRPDLAHAVVCQVPLLDMKRFSHLLAGASWMAEYGNPDVAEDWAFIKTWSPYHNLHQDVKYPEALFITSTRDDRVHPGHARKMVAKMRQQGHPVLYYENTEGGHAAAADHSQKARMTALEISYLWWKLGPEVVRKEKNNS